MKILLELLPELLRYHPRRSPRLAKRTKIKVRTVIRRLVLFSFHTIRILIFSSGDDTKLVLLQSLNYQHGLFFRVKSIHCYYFLRIGTCVKKTLLVVPKAVIVPIVS